MAELLGEEFPAFLKALTEGKRTYGLRVNTLKLPPRPFRGSPPGPYGPFPGARRGFTTPRRPGPAPTPSSTPGSTTSRSRAPRRWGSSWTRSPGKGSWTSRRPRGARPPTSPPAWGEGASFGQRGGRQTGAGPSGERGALGGPLAVTQAPPRALAEAFGTYFHRVLLDAPCSGEGMFRKDREAARHWGPSAPKRMAEVQKALLAQARRLLGPGGCWSTPPAPSPPRRTRGWWPTSSRRTRSSASRTPASTPFSPRGCRSGGRGTRSSLRPRGSGPTASGGGPLPRPLPQGGGAWSTPRLERPSPSPRRPCGPLGAFGGGGAYLGRPRP